MTLGDRRNKHDGRRGIAIAHAPAVEFVPVSLLQDTVCRRARMAVVNAVHATDELASRLSRLQLDPGLEFWCTTSGLHVNLATDGTGASLEGRGCENGACWVSQPTTLTFAGSGSHALRIRVREDGVWFDQIGLRPTTYFEIPPGPASNDATIVLKP